MQSILNYKILFYISIAILVLNNLNIFLIKNESFKWKKLVIIGDSNAQQGYNSNQAFWLSLLADKLQRQCDVVNRGFSGYNTRYIRLILPKLMSEFDSEEIVSVVILIGTNDSNKNKLQNVPIDKYAENLQWIIDYLVKFGINKNSIILINPPKIGANIYEYEDNVLQKYAIKCEELAMKNNISNVDLYTLMSSNEKIYLQNDGIHLSPKGGELLFENLWRILKEKNLITKTYFPYFKDIDYNADLKELPE